MNMANLKIEVLYEDKYIIVVDKPPGIPSQATMDPKREHMLSLMQKQCPELKLFLHHRLDRDTSGVFLLSKHPGANKPLTDIFRDHKIQKTYLSINKLNPKWSENKWDVKNHLAPVKNNNRQLMRMVVVKKGGWYAETHFEVVDKFQRFQKLDQAMNENSESKNTEIKKNVQVHSDLNLNQFLLIKSLPVTGRTHQIRVHTAENKMPILGDTLYGGKSSLVPRLMLHASSLELAHPITQESLKIHSPLPKDFMTFLSHCQKIEV